jgi:hypothetical protein
MGNISGYIAIFLAVLLAGLLIALVFRRDFRDAVLGGPGEATLFGLLTVKGVAIVLLCGLLMGGILFALTHSPPPPAPVITAAATNNPVSMRLNVNFEPNDVNPRNPKFSLRAFIKTPKGNERIPVVPKVEEGGLSILITVPDMQTPFFIVFETPNGVWQTDDYSITEAHATARKQGQE